MHYPLCVRCYRPKPYVNDEGLCEICEEYGRLIARESLRVMGIVCSHCGQTFTEKKFDRHRWSCFYRDRTLVIRGQRRRR